MLKKIIQRITKNFGYRFTKIRALEPIIQKDKCFLEIYNKCKEYTTATIEEAYSYYKAVQYIIRNKIPGDFVECGVWKGGVPMLIAYTLIELGENSKKIYLYDTFEGMAKPTKEDIYVQDKHSALKRWKDAKGNWCYSSLQEVKNNLVLINYPEENLVFVKGKVEDTLKKIISKRIAFLKLDTEWYESIKNELVYLFPKLSKKGILIVDYYDEWEGTKKAVDKYLKRKSIFLNRIGKTGRIGVNV